MAGPVLRWCVIAMTLAWFGLVVPFHERGRVKLAGSVAVDVGACDRAPRVSAARRCCNKPVRPAPGEPGDTSPHDCAVCHVAKTIDAPAPPDFAPAPAGLAEVRPIPLLSSLRALDAPREHAGRGPPVANHFFG